MATVTQEQLVKYIRSLEDRVRKYQDALKTRDEEITKLKSQMVKLLRESQSPATSFAPPVAAQSRDAASAMEIPNAKPTPTPETPPTKPAVPVVPAVPKKAVPLQEKTASFVKKPAPGVNESIKAAVRESIKETAKEPIMEISSEPGKVPSPAAALSNAPVEGIDDGMETESIPDEPLPDWAQDESGTAMPAVNFNVGEFLGAVLEGEEDAEDAKRYLEKLATSAPEERRPILLSLSSLHWRIIGSMAKRMVSQDLPWEKRLFMRFGMLDDRLMADRMDVWNQLYLDKSRPEETGIYYLDEWLDAIIRGDHKYSTIDEMALEGAKPDPNASGALALKYESLSVPQMQRMCIGPRANQVSILIQDYCAPGRDNPAITRKWVKTTMMQMQKYDSKMFHCKYKGEETVVQPLFIITPGYGQRSGCWEPWNPGKKGTTGPRICLTVFPPRNSYKALLMGIADYRWEYAKADAMHYWLTDGLTGNWIGLFNKKEQRKDLKQNFIECYYHWAMNESRRIPKLEKRFRDFFWVNIPFSDEIKQNLKGGGMFARMIELEEGKKKREEEERIEIERIKAEREARKAARQAKMG